MCPFLKWIWDSTKNIKPIPFDESDYTWKVIVSGADNHLEHIREDVNEADGGVK